MLQTSLYICSALTDKWYLRRSFNNVKTHPRSCKTQYCQQGLDSHNISFQRLLLLWSTNAQAGTNNKACSRIQRWMRQETGV